MINLTTLKSLLNISDDEIQRLDIEQLRLLLGTLRYRVRSVEREINRRCGEKPFGNVTKLQEGVTNV